MEVRALHGSSPERGVARELERLRDRYDLRGLEWTSVVIVDGTPGTIPHSHPVLTLSTRRRGALLLATYLHEQLHWWLSTPAVSETSDAASRELRAHWSDLPGGEHDASTYLHLIVCFLEIRAVEAVAGGPVAESLLEARVSGKVYPWVYLQVREHSRWLGELCERLDILPARLRDDLSPR